jgi:hypothetical protein
MITCQLSGGLGNQLFQVFTTLSYSITYNISVLFDYINETTPYSTSTGVKNRTTYWNTFFVHIISLTTFSLPDNGKIDVAGFFPFKEPRPEYIELPQEIASRNMKLTGYFQSYKYFERNKKYILKLIKWEKMKKMIMDIYSQDLDLDENSISLHFRLGDYQFLSEKHPIQNVEYYKRAIAYITDRRGPQKVFYFCQKEDNEMVDLEVSLLREAFPECTFIKVPDTMSDWEQLIFMACCRDNIIANSTFSWWGAYLNTNEKIVCFPSRWYGTSVKISTRDMFPPTWTEILS